MTDVDDKINARATERGISIRELTEETYRNFKEDVAALGCLPPTVEPRATEHAAALAGGGTSDGAPGPRAEYSDRYYAAFVRDPDGNRIEAVTFADP